MRNNFQKSDYIPEINNPNNISIISNINGQSFSGKNKNRINSVGSNLKINPNNEFINSQLDPEKFNEYM